MDQLLGDIGWEYLSLLISRKQLPLFASRCNKGDDLGGE